MMWLSYDVAVGTRQGFLTSEPGLVPQLRTALHFNNPVGDCLLTTQLT
jgi:hypothetical protein